MRNASKRFVARSLIWANTCLLAAVMSYGFGSTGLAQDSSASPDKTDGAVVANPQSVSKPAFATSPVQKSLETTPWFDAQKNEIVPIAITPRTDDSIHRDSRWLPKPETVKKTTTQPKTSNTGTTTTGTVLFGSSVTMGNVFGWVLLVVLALAIVGITVYAISRAEINLPDGKKSGKVGSGGDGLPDEQMLERIKHLPAELRRTDVNLRTECERLMLEGRFDQAIILMLGHQLLLLDRNGLLRLSRGKTNGRYVRETRTNDHDCATYLRATADAFEQSYFGRHEIPENVFHELWKQNELLERAATVYGVAK
ncbi:MAG: hypothetical protein KDB00_18675 [Planctomycetales bacterium]|nr:hypothetical protein [Planctomycetales bacterium]